MDLQNERTPHRRNGCGYGAGVGGVAPTYGRTHGHRERAWDSDRVGRGYVPDGSWFGFGFTDRTRSPSAQRLRIRRGCRGRSPDLRLRVPKIAGFSDPSLPRFPIVLSWRDRHALGMPRYRRHFVSGRPVFLTLVYPQRNTGLGGGGPVAIALEPR